MNNSFFSILSPADQKIGTEKLENLRAILKGFSFPVFKVFQLKAFGETTEPCIGQFILAGRDKKRQDGPEKYALPKDSDYSGGADRIKQAITLAKLHAWLIGRWDNSREK